MTDAVPAQASARGALTASIIAYALWGLPPLYPRMVGATGAGPLEIIRHRAAWALPWAGLLVLGAGQGRG